MTPSFNGLQLLSFAKSMTTGRDSDPVDCEEHAEPINKVEAMRVTMAKGQEERSTAIRGKHSIQRLVHRDAALVGCPRCTDDLDRFAFQGAMEFPPLFRKLAGVKVGLAHLLGPIGSE